MRLDMYNLERLPKALTTYIRPVFESSIDYRTVAGELSSLGDVCGKSITVIPAPIHCWVMSALNNS